MYPLRDVVLTHDPGGDDTSVAVLSHLRERLRREEAERDAEADRIHRQREADREAKLTSMGDD